ncbi:solute carrier family 25 member 32-like [Styela clava]
MPDKKITSDVTKTFRYEHLVAGLSGGVTSTLVLHPLDLIKIRFAVTDGLTSRPKYKSLWHCGTTVWKLGGIRGLYSGVTPNIVGNGLSWGLYFFYYNTFKVLLGDGSANPHLTVPKYLLCGCISGSMTLALTNPIWITKTRLCLEYETQNQRYRGMTHALTVLYKEDGFKGLYKGFVPGLVGTSHGAVQFLVYENLKHWYRDKHGHGVDYKMGAMECILMSAVSKMIAASSTYPYQVVRARLQDQHQRYNGVIDVVKKTWKNETWRGFYKGLGANLLRVTPACCITFYMYESVSHYLIHGSTANKSS